MVYVDNLKQYSKISIKAKKYGNAWCHLTADTIEELHDFAKKIGLSQSWFQNHIKHPHYDLTSNKRELAIKNGAREK